MLSLLGMRCYFFLFLLVFQTVSSLIPDDSYSEYVPDYGDEVVEQSYGPEFDVESGKPDYPPSCKEFGFPDGKIMDEDKEMYGCPPKGTSYNNRKAFNASPKCKCGRRGEPVCAEGDRKFGNECQLCCFNKCLMPKGFVLNRYETCPAGVDLVNWGAEDAPGGMMLPNCKRHGFPDGHIPEADKVKEGCPKPGTSHNDKFAFDASRKCDCSGRGEPVCSEAGRRFRNECTLCCFNKCLLPKGFDLDRYQTCPAGGEWTNWGYSSNSASTSMSQDELPSGGPGSVTIFCQGCSNVFFPLSSLFPI